jgi:hypothetical protein
LLEEETWSESFVKLGFVLGVPSFLAEKGSLLSEKGRCVGLSKDDK